MPNNQLNLKSQSTSQSIIIVGAPEMDILKEGSKVSDQDFFLLDDDYSIAHIKELLHFINLKPYNSTRKLIVIKNIENLTIQTANALLKTIEEPPPYATIILTTLNEQKILPTISSRCSKIRLGLKIDLEEVEDYLSPAKLGKMSVVKRFKWAAKIAEEGTAEKIILLWLGYFREELLRGEDVILILTKICRARDLLQTNISVKLLLESLTLSFD